MFKVRIYIILLLCISFLNGNSYSKSNIYLEEKLIVEPDKGIIDSAINRESKFLLDIKFIGPDKIKKGSNGKFVLYINLINSSSAGGSYISDYNFSVISSEGFIELVDHPYYYASTSYNKYFLVEDKTENLNRVYRYASVAGKVLKLGISHFSRVGKIYAAIFDETKTLSEYYDNEKGYILRGYYFISNYDEYLIPSIEIDNVFLKHKVKSWRIEIPFRAVGDNGKLFLEVKYLKIKGQQKEYTIGSKNYCLINTNNLAEDRYGVVFDNRERKKIINVIDGFKIETNIKVMASQAENYLKVNIRPLCGDGSYAQIKSISGALKIRKEDGNVLRVPICKNDDGEVIRHLNRDELKLRKLLSESFLIAYSLVPYIGPFIATLKTIEEISNELIKAKRGHSENLEAFWATEREYNVFVIPEYENNKIDFTSKEGLTLIIPIGLMKSSTQNIELFLRGVLHYGPKKEKWGRITGTTAVDHYIDYEYKMDMKIKDNSENVVIGLIIDSSGSMEKNDPDDIRKKAAYLVADKMKDQNIKIFVVDFDDDAVWLNEDNWDEWDIDRLKQSIRKIDSDGGTNIGIGLTKMHELLVKNIGENVFGGILLFTDGIGEYNNEARYFAKLGIPVFTISFIGEENAVLLNDIARITGGEYIKAKDPSDIAYSFIRFINRIAGRMTIVSERNKINLGEKKTSAFSIDSYIEDILATCFWSGSKIEVEFISPNGKVYRASNKGEDWLVGCNYVMWHLDKPEKGEWSAIFFGKDVPITGEDYTFEVSTISKLSLNLMQISDEPVKLAIDCNYYVGYISDVNARILTPDGKVEVLRVDTRSSELNLAHYNVSGSYTIMLDIDGRCINGEEFQRYIEKSILIGQSTTYNKGNVSSVIGRYVRTGLGRDIGNREGVTCYIYPSGGNVSSRIAQGYVTFAGDTFCIVEIQRMYGTKWVEVGDTVELDKRQWRGDY